MNVGGRIIQANGAVSVADAIDITGIAYAHDDIQALADVRITDYLIIEDVAAASIITVTGWITPTRSNQRILAEAWVTPTVNGGCVPGLMWFLYNWGAPNIYLADGSALILAGDFTMGQHDTLILMCNQGGNWAELSRSNN
jgi:nucleoside phosphorylase